MRRLVPFLLAALPLAAGCGGTKTVPVSGVVTMNGNPLPNVLVRFEPIPEQGVEAPGSPASGITDAQGRFTLKLDDGSDTEGALPGKHRVSISTNFKEAAADSDVGLPVGEEPIPERYNVKTELTFEVPAAGTDAAKFDLQPE